MTVDSSTREDGGVLHLTLSAPKGNILDAAMLGALREAIAGSLTAQTRVMVFEGAGKHFSFGASVPEHQKSEAAGMLEKFHGLFRELARLSVPTAAIVRGQCLGGGLELASWCTWIFAQEGAQLGQPEMKLAVFPPMASLVLPWRIGGGNAADLCVSGRSVDAQAALRMGLVTAVGDDPSALFTTFYRENLAPMSASSLRHGERAVRADLIEQLDTRLPKLEALYLEELMETHDANEGISSFLERRKPTFTHS